MDIDEVNNIMNDIDDSVAEIKRVSDSIISKYTEDLDNIMITINTDIISANVVSDELLEKNFLELTNAIYFIGSRAEFLGLYEDVSKSTLKLKYNQAYGDNQVNSSANGKKATIDDNRIYAENNSINESVANAIYSRSFRIIKAKIDSANEMIKTLSKILSKRMSEKDYSKFTKVNNEFNFGNENPY